ncbi:uncharacterized protein LOC143256330 isoform X2 [Tachypleus tridentatus]|uniref:uncharacterized protein LOC143256330 isoform X2 n=1 Tax=Tachypleus tridentatus TaxID=6853 RepID=UPI003FCFC14F
MAPTPYQYPAEVYNSQVPTGLSEYDSSQPIPTLTFTNKNYTSVQNMLGPACAIDLNLAMATTGVTNTNIQQDIQYPYVPVKIYETSGSELDGEDSAFSSDIKPQDMTGYHRLNNFNDHYVYRSNFRQDGRQCGVTINRPSRDAQGTRTRYNKMNDN